MVENGTGLLSGQLQVHSLDYRPERSLYETIGGRDGADVEELLRAVTNDPAIEAAAGSLGPAAIRGEAVVQRDEGETVFRETIGVDCRVDVFKRDFYVVVEYQRDGFGAASPKEYTDVFMSPRVSEGRASGFGSGRDPEPGAVPASPLVELVVPLVLESQRPELIAVADSHEPDDGLSASRTSVFPRVSAICAAVRSNRPVALTSAPASTRAVTAAAFAPTTA